MTLSWWGTSFTQELAVAKYEQIKVFADIGLLVYTEFGLVDFENTSRYTNTYSFIEVLWHTFLVWSHLLNIQVNELFDETKAELEERTEQLDLTKNQLDETTDTLRTTEKVSY